MPKISIPLNELKIKSAKPRTKEYTLSDGKGLHLLIKPNGTKLWEFVFTSPLLHKRRKSSFGTYPDVTLKQARNKREEYRKLIYDGKDPIDLKKELKRKSNLKEESIFKKVCYEWLEKQEDRLAATTYKRKVDLFKVDVISFFKNRSIDTIQHPEIVKLLEMKAIKAPVVADRLYGYLNNLWQYSTMKGYCDFNIIANIDKKIILPPIQKKHYSKITDLIILKELINAINNYHGNYSTKNALKFVLHIPLRASNLVGLQWEYIDFKNKLLTIPRGKMKVSNINLPDFKMPLSDEVIKILEEQKLFVHNQKYVFISDNNKSLHINKETCNRALQRMGFNDEKRERKQRLHSFRGTFRSLAKTYQREHNCNNDIMEVMLDHHTSNTAKNGADRTLMPVEFGHRCRF